LVTAMTRAIGFPGETPRVRSLDRRGRRGNGGVCAGQSFPRKSCARLASDGRRCWFGNG